MKKTLGGDRLGSGNKMTVEMRNYDRSTQNPSFIFRSSMSAGTLVPFMCEVALPGDTWDIDLDCDMKTHPTIGPLFGSYKVQLDVFEAPFRLYNSWLHNNRLGIGRQMSTVKLPLFELSIPPYVDLPTAEAQEQINPSCLLAYLGIRGVGFNGTGGTVTRDFNAIPLLAYWEIYKNYYANKQEEIGVVIHTDTPALNETLTLVELDGITLVQEPSINPIPLTNGITLSWAGSNPIPSQIMLNTTIGRYSVEELSLFVIPNVVANKDYAQFNLEKFGELLVESWGYITDKEVNPAPPELKTFPLQNIDTMRSHILTVQGSSAFNVSDYDLEPYKLVIGKNADDYNYMLNSQEGLAIKTYNSDLFNNWLKTEWIDGVGGISDVTSIDTSGGSFTIDTLNLSKKVYDMLNRIAVSGGSFDDWIDTVYTENKYTRAESPIYHGGLIKELVFQEVVSNAEATNESGSQPLGTLAGKGILGKKHKGGKVRIKVSEPGYIIGIVSLTPRIDYSQGNKWDIHLKTMDDLHKPALDEIGFQEAITEYFAWWDTQYLSGDWIQKSAGKQPAWINYMTNVNRTFGNFAIENNEMFMTLNRRYEKDLDTVPPATTIKDLTTYIDPVKFNQIFAQTSLDAQNFWCQIAVDIEARRLMSAKIMPNL